MEAQQVFIKPCEENSKDGLGAERAKNYCNCMPEKIEVIYPDAKDADKLTITKTIDLANDCLDKFPATEDSVISKDSIK